MRDLRGLEMGTGGSQELGAVGAKKRKASWWDLEHRAGRREVEAGKG